MGKLHCFSKLQQKSLTECSNTWKYNDTFPYKLITQVWKQKKIKILKNYKKSQFKSQMLNIDV